MKTFEIVIKICVDMAVVSLLAAVFVYSFKSKKAETISEILIICVFFWIILALVAGAFLAIANF